jgi:hypothetical protein
LLNGLLLRAQIALYPIGIPLFFFWMLRRYRKRMKEPDIRVQLGFLYEGGTAIP